MGLGVEEAVWDVTVFTKNRERLMKGEVAERLLLAVVEQAHAHRLLSEEHFTVDGTLIPGLGEPAQLPREAGPAGQGYRSTRPQAAARHP